MRLNSVADCGTSSLKDVVNETYQPRDEVGPSTGSNRKPLHDSVKCDSVTHGARSSSPTSYPACEFASRHVLLWCQND